MTIGERVLYLLQEQGKKQKDLADYIHAGRSTVNQWVVNNRNPSSEMIIPICEFLGVSTSYLLTGKEDEKLDHTKYDPLDVETIRWLHKLNEETRRDFLGEIRLHAKRHPEDLMDTESISDTPESQDGRMISSK